MGVMGGAAGATGAVPGSTGRRRHLVRHRRQFGDAGKRRVNAVRAARPRGEPALLEDGPLLGENGMRVVVEGLVARTVLSIAFATPHVRGK
jgi:hypothetical protein